MTRCPFAKWIGTPDHFGYPPGIHDQLRPLAICDHIMCGTLKGCDAWFNGGGLSATFGIGKNGDIHQYVELEDIAWANGSVANPDPALAYIYENYNPNVVTWSIEHEGWPWEQWTEAMYQADLKLKRYLLGLEPELALVGHFQFDSVNRADCPGSPWPRERLIADLKEGGNGMAGEATWTFYLERVRQNFNRVRAATARVGAATYAVEGYWPLSDADKANVQRQDHENDAWRDLIEAKQVMETALADLGQAELSWRRAGLGR